MLAMLQNTGKSQMVFSHKKETENASLVVFGPRLRRGLDHATDSLRLAALARSNGEDGKEKGCTEGAKRPPRIMCVFRKRDLKSAVMVPKTTPNHRNDAETVPFEARGLHKLKNQARTAP